MLEQMNQIAECLNENKLEWGCCFTVYREIAGSRVRFAVRDTGKSLEMTAYLPHRIDELDLDRYRDLAERLDHRVEVGEFRVDEEEMCLTYRIYSMRTRLGEIKDKETIAYMLEQCREVLEQNAAAFVLSHTPTLFERLRERVFGLMHLEDYADDDDAEYDYDDPYDDPMGTDTKTKTTT